MYKGRGREKKEKQEKASREGKDGPFACPSPCCVIANGALSSSIRNQGVSLQTESSCSTQTNLNRQLKNTGADMSLNGIGKCN